jgi:hypothetical protein
MMLDQIPFGPLCSQPSFILTRVLSRINQKIDQLIFRLPKTIRQMIQDGSFVTPPHVTVLHKFLNAPASDIRRTWLLWSYAEEGDYD